MRPKRLWNAALEAISVTNDFKCNYDPAEVAGTRRFFFRQEWSRDHVFRLFCDVGKHRRVAGRSRELLAREKMNKYCRVRGRAFPQGSNCTRSWRRRAHGRGHQGRL